MLTEFLPRWEDYKFVRILRNYFASVWYIITIVALMVLSNLFSLELLVFYLYMIFGVLATLFCKDTLPIVPIACCSYMTVSAENNYAATKDSVFFQTWFLAQFIFILVVAAIFLLARFITIVIRKKHYKVPALMFGFAVLGFAYIVAGAFSGNYDIDAIFFGFVEIASLCGLYFYFYFTLDWDNVTKSYLFTLFVAIGFGMMFEVARMYFLPGAVVDGVVNRGAMYTGWGTYNNVGGIAVMCLPAPFYFSVKHPRGWIFTVIGHLFFLSVLLTQSRAAMVTGTVIYAACAVFVIVKLRGSQRLKNIAVYAVAVVTAIVTMVIMRDKIGELFASIVGIGSDDNGRFEIYKDCIGDFLSAPSFGVGFYSTHGYRQWNWNLEKPFLPPRAHNTIIQMLASGGLFAFICYLVHRVETVLLIVRRPSVEKTVIGFIVAALLIVSLFDCHFFNFGPGLLYGIVLVFAERLQQSDLPQCGK